MNRTTNKLICFLACCILITGCTPNRSEQQSLSNTSATLNENNTSDNSDASNSISDSTLPNSATQYEVDAQNVFVTKLSSANLGLNHISDDSINLTNSKAVEIELKKQVPDSTLSYVENCNLAVDFWNDLILQAEKSYTATNPDFQATFDFWELFEEQAVALNFTMYHTNALYAGSMYVPFSCEQLEMKHELFFLSLCSLDSELADCFEATNYTNVSWSDYSSALFEYEESSDYIELIKQLDLSSKDNSELKDIIISTCTALNQNTDCDFDFLTYANTFISYEESLAKLEENAYDNATASQNERQRIINFITEIVSLQSLIGLV